MHSEFWHVVPAAHTLQRAPHALLLLVVSAHAPAQHVPPGHAVPFGVFTTFVQVGPEEQSLVPVWQMLPLGLHGEPGAHATQTPALQTTLEPQVVPSGRFAVGVHVTPGDEHVIDPFWHGLPGVHDAPGVHWTHCEFEQNHPDWHGVHDGPQALLSLVVSTQAPAHCV